MPRWAESRNNDPSSSFTSKFLADCPTPMTAAQAASRFLNLGSVEGQDDDRLEGWLGERDLTTEPQILGAVHDSDWPWRVV